MAGDVAVSDADEVEGLELLPADDAEEVEDNVDDEDVAPSSICCGSSETIGFDWVPFDIFDGLDTSQRCALFLNSSIARSAASLRDMVG